MSKVTAQEFVALTDRQQRLLVTVSKRQEEIDHVRNVLARAQAEQARAVSDAVKGGVPVRLLARQLDVSLSRVYKIREESRHREPISA